MADKKDIGVIFDMDGVLVDSANAHYESWRRLGVETGKTITREQFLASFGRQSRDVIKLFFGDLPDDQIKAMDARKESIFRDLIRGNPPIVPGAVELVRGLKAHGVRLAIGSSAPRENVDIVLDAADIREAFDVIVSAKDVTRGKPDPQIYATTCDRLRLPPSQCVVIEDAPVGVRAAKAAGAKCIAVMTEQPREALSAADLIVKRLADLTPERVISLVVEPPAAR